MKLFNHLNGAFVIAESLVIARDSVLIEAPEMPGMKALDTSGDFHSRPFLASFFTQMVVDTMGLRWYIDRASFQEEATDLEN